MIATLLVANRGEIASRIIRTAAAMGIGTVAVYAEGDAGAPYVTEADRAVALPGRTAAQTYLDIDALLAAAGAAGADAVHPGYGFLSERADFARAVTAAGLTWVGPPAEVIEAMGDKLAAKRLLADVGVPVLESWEVTGDGLPDTGGVPLPLIVKAAMGGGGKGMRVVGANPANWPRRWRPPGVRRRLRSATARCSSSGTSPTPGTWRSRSSRTATAGSCTASSGSARSSGGTRRSSRSAPRPPWTPACGGGWARPRWPPPRRSGTWARAPSSSSSSPQGSSGSSR